MTSSRLNAQSIVSDPQDISLPVHSAILLPGKTLPNLFALSVTAPQAILPTSLSSNQFVANKDDIRLALRLALGDLNVSLHRNTVKALAKRIISHLQPQV